MKDWRWSSARPGPRWALALLLLASVTDAQINLYVAPAGFDGTNDCRQAGQPCATVGHALTQSSLNNDILNIATGVYTEAGLTVEHNITMVGAGTDATILQPHADPHTATSRVLWIKTGATATVEGITFRHGQTTVGATGVASVGFAGGNGGGLLVNGAAILRHCRITDNATGAGGAGAAGFNGGRGGHGAGLYSDGWLAMEDTVVADNVTGPGGPAGTGAQGGAGGDGAAVHLTAASTMDRCSIYHNQNGSGGAGTTGGNAGQGGLWVSGQLDVWSSTISDNSSGQGGSGTDGSGGAGGSGAGLLVATGAVVTLQHVTLAGNHAGLGGSGSSTGPDGSGGGIWCASGTVSFTHTIVASNTVGGAGSGPDIKGTWVSTGYNLVETASGWSAEGSVVTLLSPVASRLQPLTVVASGHAYRALVFASPAVNAGDPVFAAPPSVDQLGGPRIQGGRIDVGAYEFSNTVLHVAVDGDDVERDCRAAGLPCATLDHAVAQSLAGDTIQIHPGVYVVENIPLDQRLDIQGEAASNTILQAAESASAASQRLFFVADGVTARLARLTLQHGHAPDGLTDGVAGESGGAINNEGSLFLVDCVVQSNRAGRGADHPDEDGSGGAGGHGGAIFNAGHLAISNSLFQYNEAGTGGDAGANSVGGNGGSGGAIYNDNESTLTLVLSQCIQNQAGPGGTNGLVGGEGGLGGALMNNSDMALDRVEVSDNRAGDGGWVNGAVAGVGGSGGGIYNAGGPAVMNRSTIAFNQAGMGAEPGRGGGLYNEAEIEVVNSTLFANQAHGDGGGIYNENQMSLRHGTVVSNQSGVAGGGIFNSPSITMNVGHLLLAENHADDAGPNAAAELLGEGYVLVGDDAGLSFAGGSDLSGNSSQATIHTLSFGWNGGPTRTLPLAGGSAGINQGDPGFIAPPDTDQRGQPRVQAGRIDIGAYETGYDSDQDGLPDDWEAAYGLDPYDPGMTNGLTGPAGDLDGDGYDNRSEFIALTRPDQTQDYFRVRSVRRSNDVQVGFFGVTGRLYTLRYADTPVTSTWINVVGQVDVAGTGATNALQETLTAQRRMYQLQVRLAE